MDDLDVLREELARLEEPVIFALIERARFKQNLRIYQPGGIAIPDYGGTFLDCVLADLAALRARTKHQLSIGDPVGRNGAGASLSAHVPVVGPLVVGYYVENLVPAIAEPGDSPDAFATVLRDLAALDAINRRIEYGIPIAEAKYESDRAGFDLIMAPERNGEIRDKLRDGATEEKLLKRVRTKSEAYHREKATYSVDPQVIVNLFEQCLMPAMLDIQVAHLLHRSLT